MKNHNYKAVVVGASSGGMNALLELFSSLPSDYPLPIIVVQHLHPTESGYLVEHFNNKLAIAVKEAADKEEILPGNIYFAPPDYHLLVEQDGTFALSIDRKVSYSRPSIDVLFESASYVWESGLVGVLLTGANMDGANGMRRIKEHGGLTIAQDPKTASCPIMPQSAIAAGAVDKILALKEMGGFLKEIIGCDFSLLALVFVFFMAEICCAPTRAVALFGSGPWPA